MVERQVVVGAAILAREPVAQEHVEPREGRVAGRLDVALQRHDRGQLHRERGAAHRHLVFGDDVHPLQENRLDRILPGPQRQGVVAERPVIRIEDQCRIGPRRDGNIHGDSRIPLSDEWVSLAGRRLQGKCDGGVKGTGRWGKAAELLNRKSAPEIVVAPVYVLAVPEAPYRCPPKIFRSTAPAAPASTVCAVPAI